VQTSWLPQKQLSHIQNCQEQFILQQEIEKAGGKAHPCIVDVRDEGQVQQAVNEAVNKFGGIDIVINNASAISLTGTLQTDMKRYDLMNQINTRGTFLVSKVCLPHLLKSNHAHILNISPPLNMSPKWFGPNVAYTIAKYGMSMCVLGMAEEFKDQGVGVNALWPRTAIHTAAIEMLMGKESFQMSRKPEIMADAAYAVLIKEPRSCTGQFLIDDEVLEQAGVKDLAQYACDPAYADKLVDDFFLEPKNPSGPSIAQSDSSSGIRVPAVFEKIQAMLSPEIVAKTQAVFQFNLEGEEKGVWFIDLKSGSGSCGKGPAPTTADATLTMKSNNFFDMFAGKLKPAPAFMSGKLKITGDLQKAMKLEKLMKSFKAKL
jgi:NAD(P)-dependent dehydrogenase (short-subunit alcohol dehydrogenase family)/putative sterol carrier protein